IDARNGYKKAAPRCISLQTAPSPSAINLSTTDEEKRGKFLRLGRYSLKSYVCRNQDFQRSVKELKEKTEGVKEDLKVRTKQTTEELYKHVDGAWTEAEATAKKVSTSFKEKVSAATEEVKGTFGTGKQEPSEPSGTKANNGSQKQEGSEFASGEDKQQQAGHNDTSETIYSKIKSSVSSMSPKVSVAFQKFKEAKPTDLAKKGYDIVKDELSGNPSKRKRFEATPSPDSSPKVERSVRTDVVVVPTKQSRWSKIWEKVQSHPIFKRATKISEPVVTKGQELAEDVREALETTDNPILIKLQDLNESVFAETDTAMSFKEIRRRDPSFSLPEFVGWVQDIVKPVLTAYLKGDTEALATYCSPEVIERCRVERKAYESSNIYFDNKILHISDVDLKETKMMGDTPIIIVAFQTQQIYCVRDSSGSIKEGGKDTIHTVLYAWAMQQIDGEEGSFSPIWRLREMQQLNMQALI
ncbi:hypothetical protein RJ639_009615, partial [Escallonia herrerae]